MQFKTPFDFSKSEFKTATGEFTRPTYKAVLAKNGEIELEQDGIEMTYEKIQSFADSVDINVIVSRFAAGDAAALNQINGSYGDFVEVPSSYMEALNVVVEARSAYEQTAKDISFEEFINRALMPVYKALEPIDKEEIKNEQKSE